jgi:hypothetical protein
MQVSVQHFRNVGLAVSSVVNRALECSHVTDTLKAYGRRYFVPSLGRGKG